MDTLLQELIDRIVSHLDHDDLKSMLVLSRKFQYACEEGPEAFAQYNLTIDNAPKFKSTYSGRRSRYLRELVFETSVFPRDENAAEDCRDTSDELSAMNKGFRRQIKFFFDRLKSV
ncbi:hypothetical protein BU25DRAFT_407777 [Macroventuria anomochaeta]|uniref:Uncharacterized protein n=1 Tax=Macroventuria anomochaeta TaxID=301207 RepID=A0ACB6SDD1_9PLEO|nr:uncharacterized protein BU25DRAFT_407777 [Macroventuria anomochaeta]KAF2631254.1 hypothetical protein BU25DRAFT_407777 [Macroventuria anomochaeta]